MTSVPIRTFDMYPDLHYLAEQGARARTVKEFDRSERASERCLFSPAGLVVRLNTLVFWCPQIKIGAFARFLSTYLNSVFLHTRHVADFRYKTELCF